MLDFYVLEHTGEFAEVVQVSYKHRKCGRCGARPQARVGPIHIRFKKKKQVLDFVPTTDGDCIHQRVADALTESLLSGWRPGMIGLEAAGRLPGAGQDQEMRYCEFVVIGHTRNYAERTGLQIEYECTECGYQRYARPRTAIDMPEQCWDGSDVFLIEELPGFCIVTDAFKEVVERHKFSGVTFTDITRWLDYPP